MRQDLLLVSVVLMVVGAALTATFWLCFAGIPLLGIGLIILLLAVVMEEDYRHPGYYPPPAYGPPLPPPGYSSPCPYCHSPMQFNQGRYWCPRCQRYV